jgi:hypothetical protein
MKIALSFLIALLPSIAFACFSNDVNHKMAAELYQDEDFRLFICDQAACSESDFFDGLEFHAQKASRDGSVTVCLVGPITKAENYYTGVFTKSSRGVYLNFVSFSSDVKISMTGSKFATLTEFVDEDQGAQQTSETIYRWSGKTWVPVASRSLSP